MGLAPLTLSDNGKVDAEGRLAHSNTVPKHGLETLSSHMVKTEDQINRFSEIASFVASTVTDPGSSLPYVMSI